MDPVVRDRWLARAHGRLAAAGLRHGTARAGVVEFLAREGQCLLGAQEVWEGTRASGGRASQASVYRVLDELHGLGLLTRIVGQDGAARYEIADPGSHHHHVVDDRTGEVWPFTDRGLEDAIAAAAGRLGIRLSGHDIVLRGTRAAPAGGPPG